MIDYFNSILLERYKVKIKQVKSNFNLMVFLTITKQKRPIFFAINNHHYVNKNNARKL